MSDRQRLTAAIRLFDDANSRDPNQLSDETGQRRPAQLLHAERMSRWVARLEPNPSEALLLAARAQHIERWTIPRSSYPPGRLGYKTWRSRLARFHAERTREILTLLGYPSALIARVEAINLKRDIKGDPDTQTVEDALCLLFLEHQLTELAHKTADEAKLVAILRKTWGKLSQRGQQQALRLELPAEQRALLQQATGPRSRST